MQITNIKDWGLGIQTNDNEPIIISGPCSAETKEQVLQTCQQIKNHGVHIFRAGIWKPRTRPNSFEGLGKMALPWIVAAGKQANTPVCVEVANAQHVTEALKAGVDILWVGARTTVNPFAVQAIADALVGVDIPVMVKNPINPDLKLWMGALERLSNAGIHKMAVIHRGFSVYNSPKYRNPPQWEIPVELRRQVPGLEIICDPSHIAGKREWLYEIAQIALDLKLDGLMIESHITPSKAWSDAAQQVTPSGLKALLDSLETRQQSTDDPVFLEKLNIFRKRLDEIDLQTIELLAQRMEVIRQIGLTKKANNVAPLQLERWIDVRKLRLEKANEFQLSEVFVEMLIQMIHKESLHQQSHIMQQKEEQELED